MWCSRLPKFEHIWIETVCKGQQKRLRSTSSTELLRRCFAEVVSKEAINLSLHLMRILARAGLRLTKYLSNSKKVLAALSEHERAADCKDLDHEHLPNERGVRWDVETDILGIKVTRIENASTRRGCLSVTSFLILNGWTGNTCGKESSPDEFKLGWDDKLHGKLLEAWEQRKANLREGIKVPRCYFRLEGFRLNFITLRTHQK